jgi:cell division protein FtsZ
MGVGEDDSLDDAIAVTIIATGFNVDTQNEIVNTETKKIIHTLEDEQRAEHNFSSAKFDKGRQIEEETPSEKKPQRLFIPWMRKSRRIETQKPVKNDDLNTPPSARNMDVIYDEVTYGEEDFIITDTSKEVKELEVNEPEEVKNDSEDQFHVHL